MTDIPVVLASQSPRRKQLLGLLGITPDVQPANIDESWRSGEEPAPHAERLAREKAAVIKRTGALVVAADTIVVLDGDILGKPNTPKEAAVMLRRLSGRDHMVHTAIAVVYGRRMASGVESTRVWMRHLDEHSIQEYIATGEPMDKAGAYGIQGYGAVIVEKIEGDYFTVMGLGLGRLVDLMSQVGLVYRFGRLTPA